MRAKISTLKEMAFAGDPLPASLDADQAELYKWCQLIYAPVRYKTISPEDGAKMLEPALLKQANYYREHINEHNLKGGEWLKWAREHG